MKHSKLYVCLVLLLTPSIGSAQLYECAGLWSNKPCEDGAEPALKETEARERSPEQINQGVKDSLVHDLTMRNIRAKREFDVDVNIDAAVEECKKTSTSLSACREAVDELDDKMVSRIETIEARRAEQQANRLREESNQIQQQSQQVTIIDNRSSWWRYPRRRHGESHPVITVTGEGVTGGSIKQEHSAEHSHGSAGVSISGSGAAGGDSFQVNINGKSSSRSFTKSTTAVVAPSPITGSK